MKGLEAFHFRLHHETGGLELLPSCFYQLTASPTPREEGLWDTLRTRGRKNGED